MNVFVPPADNELGCIYTPLKDLTVASGDIVDPEQDTWAVRCVKLEPGQRTDPLRCELVSSHLGVMRGNYEALSYTWGDLNAKTTIFLDGRPVQVTQNLACSLRHLRLPHDGRLLWIDALCINQADGAEVNTYVQRMWAIYEGSKNVVVFLGESTQESDKALQLLTHLSGLSVVATERHSQINQLLEDNHKSLHWTALERLMQRPWWSRAWIIQEYAVAPRVIFVCGLATLDGENFGHAMDYLMDYRYSASIPHHWQEAVRNVALTGINHLLSIRKQYQSSSPQAKPSPLEILYRSRGSQASDPKDKVYSLFRLIAEDPRLQPNYSRSVEELYKDVVRAIIDNTGTLEILSHHNSGNPQSHSSMPSWCPDWTVRRGSHYLMQRNQYSAAGNTTAHAVIHGDTLRVKGRALDRIDLISKRIKYNDFKNRQARQATIERLWRLAAAKRDSEFSDYQMPDVPAAFSETLSSLRNREKGPAGSTPSILDPRTVQEMWNAWWTSCTKPSSLTSSGRKLAKSFDDALHRAIYGKAFFISQQGRFGIVDATARAGDTVAVLLGGEVLFALRETGETNDSNPSAGNNTDYNLVGEW
ncbi:hypothetical protein KVR01_005851 [Diaporthe batatas]|uniref:uncharacterized protein n=1 Tax=Diaporthe batatas TaxID=748121 RepID=UPI001D0398CC|nr:uncharacterized protein KVR01_005851 [Diaporthe batatas]KAG8163933.1 hypothetical protein KVR01_005851 [Diaporthe batatas]